MTFPTATEMRCVSELGETNTTTSAVQEEGERIAKLVGGAAESGKTRIDVQMGWVNKNVKRVLLTHLRGNGYRVRTGLSAFFSITDTGEWVADTGIWIISWGIL